MARSKKNVCFHHFCGFYIYFFYYDFFSLPERGEWMVIERLSEIVQCVSRLLQPLQPKQHFLSKNIIDLIFLHNNINDKQQNKKTPWHMIYN
jgi:hypothetical protein